MAGVKKINLSTYASRGIINKMYNIIYLPIGIKLVSMH